MHRAGGRSLGRESASRGDRVRRDGTFAVSVKEARSVSKSIPVEELIDLYRKVRVLGEIGVLIPSGVQLTDLLLKRKAYKELQQICLAAFNHPVILSNREGAEKEITLKAVIACLLNRDGAGPYRCVRQLAMENADSNRCWMLFNEVLNLAPDIRHQRFCVRQLRKHPDNVAIKLLIANNSLICGTYKTSLSAYTDLLRHEPNNPLIYLLLGVTALSIASQKFVLHQHILVTQAIVFFQRYLELRGECQESFYNLGRALHQLRIFHGAIYYYEKGLEKPCAVAGREDELDLRREIAYNLALIYRSTGSELMARHVTETYLIV